MGYTHASTDMVTSSRGLHSLSTFSHGSGASGSSGSSSSHLLPTGGSLSAYSDSAVGTAMPRSDRRTAGVAQLGSSDSIATPAAGSSPGSSSSSVSSAKRSVISRLGRTHGSSSSVASTPTPLPTAASSPAMTSPPS